MDKTFSDFLQEKMDEAKINAAELSRRSKVSEQNIGRIVNRVRHSISGALPKVTVQTAEKLAEALEWDIDEARLAAGFAPRNPAAFLLGTQQKQIVSILDRLSEEDQMLVLDLVMLFVARKAGPLDSGLGVPTEDAEYFVPVQSEDIKFAPQEDIKIKKIKAS